MQTGGPGPETGKRGPETGKRVRRPWYRWRHLWWMGTLAGLGLLVVVVPITAAPPKPPGTSTGARTAPGQPPPTTAAPISADGWALPNAAMTPGQTFAGVTGSEICTSGWAEAHRDVTETERHQVFAAYGIPYALHDQYELDHLIPLELGGDNAEANLWPEPGPIPNPKDTLEDRLHSLVCDGSLALASAQQAIATNWVSAYRTYVGGSPSAAVTPRTLPAAPRATLRR